MQENFHNLIGIYHHATQYTMLDTLPIGFKCLYTDYQCPQFSFISSYSQQFHFQIFSTHTAVHANTLSHHQRAQNFVPTFKLFFFFFKCYLSQTLSFQKSTYMLIFNTHQAQGLVSP